MSVALQFVVFQLNLMLNSASIAKNQALNIGGKGRRQQPSLGTYCQC